MNKSFMRLGTSLVAGLALMTGVTKSAQAYDINKDIDFVHNAYKDLLGVDLSYNACYSLAALMETSHIPRSGIASMITGTPSYRKHVVDALYQGYLNRPATAFDESYWVSGGGASHSLRFLRAAILGLDEFTHTYFHDPYETQAEDFNMHLMLKTVAQGNSPALMATIQNKLNGAPGNGYTHFNAAADALGSTPGLMYFCESTQYSLKMGDPGGSLKSSCYLTMLYGGTEQDAMNLYIASDVYYNRQ